MSNIEVALFGTLGRDAEHKTSKNGKPYLRLNVACSEGETTTWVNAMVFDDRAIAVADGFVKGARVYLEGKLSLNEWTASDGTTRTGLSVMSWHCRLCQIGRAKVKLLEKPKPAPQSAPAGAPFDDEITFAPERRGGIETPRRQVTTRPCRKSRSKLTKRSTAGATNSIKQRS
jgi:single-strand DNA-binding protein